ncbi:UNVERIFIED_CONTAM: hypothetical protein NCL1_39439 [Trichonephila clavipes]
MHLGKLKVFNLIGALQFRKTKEERTNHDLQGNMFNVKTLEAKYRITRNNKTVPTNCYLIRVYVDCELQGEQENG